MAWQALWEHKPDEEKARILTVMNFYKIFAAEYNDTDNLIDQATADKSIPILADRMCQAASELVRGYDAARVARCLDDVC